MSLTQIFNTRCSKQVTIKKLVAWYNDVEKLDCKFFNSVINTMQNNDVTIATYFKSRATKASAESLNVKVKAFRAQLRAIEDIPLFIFRLAKLFA